MPNSRLSVRRPRATQATIQRTLRAAKVAGLTATSAKHHPDGVVEILFSAAPANGETPNEWDT